MNKIALITDTHFGVRQDSPTFLKHTEEFFSEFFFPMCAKHQIKYVFHLGDVFDRQRFVNFNTLQVSRRCFFEPLAQHGMKAFILAGNHDVFAKNTPEVNALRSIFGDSQGMPGVECHWEPTTITLGRAQRRIALAPWATTDRYDDFKKFIWNTKADLLFGHLEIQTFMLNGGKVMEHGLQPSDFQRYRHVFSGHFHTHQSKSHITYVGSPYETSWGDYGQPHGFMILDLDKPDFDIEYIENPAKVYHKLIVSATKQDAIPRRLDGRFVRLYVDDDPKVQKRLEVCLEAIRKGGAECEVIKPTMALSTESAPTFEVEDLSQSIVFCVDQIPDLHELRRDRLVKVLTSAHAQASANH